MPIYLIRHGQTVWNVEKRMQGQLDSPLTPEGLSQAKRIGQFLKSMIQNNCVIEIISSPLGRAACTAETICNELEYDLDQITHDNHLKEADHGSWGGLTKLEAEKMFPSQSQERKANHWTYRFPGGESYADLSSRAIAWFQELNETGTIKIVVTHEMMSRCIRGHYLNLDETSTLNLSHKHDHIFVLENGKIEEIQLPN